MNLLKEELSGIELIINSVIIDDNDTLQKAITLLQNIKAVRKRITAEKDRIIKPAKEIIKQTKAKYEVLEEQCTKLEQNIKLRILDYENRKAARREIDNTELTQQIQTGKIKLEEAIELYQPTQKTKGIQIRTHKEIIITNESIIPDEYWILDMVKIRKDALAGKEIAGVTIQDKKIIATK